jgi:F0F1-type ATP synthase assembly protein I
VPKLPDSSDRKSKFIGSYAQAGAHISSGVQFAATIAFCLFAGWWLDERWSTSPLFLVSGIVFGSVAGFYHLYKTLTAEAPERQGTDVSEDE